MKRTKIESSESLPSLDDCDIPQGWKLKRLRDDLILDVQPGFACGKNSRDGKGIPHIRPMNVSEAGKIDLTDLKFVPESECSKPERFVIDGDVIFNNTNSPALVGKTAYYNLPEQRAFSNHMTRLRCNTEIIDPVFCAMALHQKWREGYYKSVCNNHVSQSSISRQVLLDTPIFLPPLAEQQYIVARVEALLTQVNAAREHLNRVPLIMKRFRQAVLAAACSGRLTEGWREEQKNLVTAADLYNRIQTIRMKKYEHAVIEAKKLKKRVPPKPSFLENCDPDSGTTTEIPDEWIWKKVVNLGLFGEDTVKTGPFGAILKSKEFVLSGIPIIAIGNVQWGKFDLNGARVDHVTEEKASELENYRVRTGDVLFTRSGTIGRSLVVPNFADHWLMSYHLLRVRADPNLIIPQYLYFVFAGCESSKDYTSDATIGSTRPGINTTILENVPVPLPPLAEQHEIVRRVGLLFERADAIDREVAAAGRRCERMTQAVLGKAFAGKLV